MRGSCVFRARVRSRCCPTTTDAASFPLKEKTARPGASQAEPIADSATLTLGRHREDGLARSGRRRF